MPIIHKILNQSGNPQRAFHDWENFCLEYSKNHSLQNLEKHPLFPLFLKLFGNSYFLIHYLTQHPNSVLPILNSSYLNETKPLASHLEELNSIQAHTAEELLNHLLHYKYQEFTRITLRKFNELAPYEEILKELSFLAKAICEHFTHFYIEEFKNTYGLPIFQEKEISGFGFSILAQGKLGANELNYSSDIDIQFIYYSDQGYVQGNSEISLHEYFIKLSTAISQLLEKKTNLGFLYRIDLNLRPEGKSGTLANSVSAMEYYYENFGQAWERQALIKASHLSGDASLTSLLLKRLKPFIWPKSADMNTLEQIRKMKEKVNDSLKNTLNPGFHIKLGKGGIRELEFFVQALQRLYGGKEILLQSPETLKALDALATLGILKKEETEEFKKAYLFLRKVENMLQALEERQVYHVPHQKEEQLSLARRLGYQEENLTEALDHFLEDLTLSQNKIHESFSNLMFKKGWEE